jgi:DNA repair exonuclease SbcCD nuclease subunit
MKPALFFTDVHISKTNTASVRKSCWNTVKSALEWIAQRAREVDAEVILCGGDITEKWNWDSSDTYALWRIFNAFPSPVYTVVGNHDVSGGKLALLPFSGLGQVLAAKPLLGDDVSTGGLLLLDRVKEFGNFRVVGYHWGDPLMSHKVDYSKIETKFDTIPLEKGSHINILVSHASVSPEPTDYAYYWKDLVIDDRIDFALFGDIHKGFGPHKLENGVVVGNPGAVYRKTFEEATYTPGIYLIYPDRTIVWEPIPVDDIEEAFYMDKRRGKIAMAKMEFNTLRAVAKTARGNDAKEFVEQVAKEAKSSREATDELLKRL